MKPDVVLFGEMLPEQAMEEAYALARGRRPAALRRLLAGGLSGRGPARGDPPRRRHVAIVTKGPTPYDADADVRLEGDVVEELEALLGAL